MSQSSPSCFLLLITGQIETADFPTVSTLYCKYAYVFGPDWSQIGGVHEGISATCERGHISNRITFSLPIEATFSSTSPFRWPQLALSCYGPDFFNHDVIRGYGAVHLPTTPGVHTRKVAMFVPEASTSIQKILGFLSGRRPEFVDPKIVATHEGREATRVSTQGLITVSFNVILKDIKQAGYDVLPSSSRLIDMPSTRELQEEGLLRPNPTVATVAPQISTAEPSSITKIEEEELSDSEEGDK